jgi:hypothetical protein
MSAVLKFTAKVHDKNDFPAEWREKSIALYYIDDAEVKILSIREAEDGSLYRVNALKSVTPVL